MAFETTLWLFLGKKAYQTAGYETNPAERRKLLRRALKRVTRAIDTIETSSAHKSYLSASAERALKMVPVRRPEPSWEAVYALLRLVGFLLGYGSAPGARTDTLRYTPPRYYTKEAMRSAIETRGKVVSTLKRDGLSDFKIALVLGAAEYEVTKRKRGHKSN
jgi:hypothetical protein